ncbi:hypothetical protein [Pseudomarimonas salicorniae]|uniref:IPTL-CTERM protein sorting domain-containing protein n=1 Tax=Pseudomarimonas salicorniae TaxID=2933270 RepID=A0ABT0GH07_9GAMM|nr:hypothetical protein [Lysobacter sp. CAU 1642]MCK7593824.1 hypothetical protein [Lysobacter sp. CAU 1642]
MKHNALALCFLGLMGFAGAASATLNAGSSNPSPGATNQSTLITYETRAGIGAVGFGISITDPNDVIVDATVQFQVFDRDASGGTGAFVNCDGTNYSTAAGTNIACSQSGQSATYAISRTSATDVPSLSNNMRVVYSISPTATDGQTATFAFGAYCTGTQTPAANGCVAYNRTSDTQRDDSPATPVANDGTVTVTVSANRTLSFAPPAGTTIAFGPGAVGSTDTEVIAVTSSGNQGTATVTGCGISGPGASSYSVTPTSLTFNGSNPTTQNLNVTCTIPASDASGTLTCTQTDAGGTPTQRQWPLTCAPAPATPDVSASPAGGAVSVGGGSVGSTASGSVVFTATGGAGSGSATISCTRTSGTLTLAFTGGTPGTTANQTVTGSADPLDLSFFATLTDAAQPSVGAFSCVITDAGGSETLNFTASAPAGSTFTPPAVIPASSLWSQLALIGLFLGLGGLVLVVRRNG